MRRLLLALTCVVIAGCPPRRPLQQCNPEECSDPGKDCQEIDGVHLCVYTCPDPAAPSEPSPCYPDQFALDIDGTCTCVPRAPAGRTCRSDAHCGLAPDTTAEPGDTQYLCAGPAVDADGSRMCLPHGTACTPGTPATPAVGCAAEQHCDPVLRLCTTCGGAEIKCNTKDDDCDPATLDAEPTERACNGVDDDCDPATPDSTTEVCGNGIDEDCDGSDAPCGSIVLKLTAAGPAKLRVRRQAPPPDAEICALNGSGVCDLETNLVDLGATQGDYELTLWPLSPGGRVALFVDGARVALYQSRAFVRWRTPVRVRFAVDLTTRTVSSNHACPTNLTCAP